MIIKDWKSLFLSMNYFLKLIFIKKNMMWVFVSSVNFNRGENGENFLFNPMIEFCKNNLSNFYLKKHISNHIQNIK